MEKIDEEQVERHPRQIKESGRSEAGHEVSDVVDVAKRLQAMVDLLRHFGLARAPVLDRD